MLFFIYFHPQNEHVAKLNEIFSQANRVTRRDKALILGFMGGCRENPMPSPENYIVIKLGETEVCAPVHCFFLASTDKYTYIVC